MGRGWQYSTTSNFFGYAPTATSEAAGFPLSRLTDWTGTHPLARTWHSTTLAQQTIICTFGAVRNGTWVALYNTNFTTVQIAVSSNAVTYTDIITGSTTFTNRTIPVDLTDGEGYRKLFLPATFTGKTNGAIVIPAQATTDGAGYYRLGLLVWGMGIVTMSHNLQVPLVEEYTQPEYRADGSDWVENVPAGVGYKTLTIRNTVANATADEWHALRLLPVGSRILGYYNLGNPAATDLWIKNRNMTITRQGKTQEVNTGFRSLA